jgi:ABC-type amino acid transport substrate-binding protein|tara:strand:+ start:3468 stop:4187 length:720 start_codon:yes stop_codon:yes gene_type:complete
MKKIISSIFGILIAVNLCIAEEYHFVSIKGLIEQDVGRIIIPEIYKNLGMTVTIQPVPGKRAQQLATSGKKDGEIMRIFTYGLENPTTIRVPTSYYNLETMAFIKKDSGIVIKSKEDLRKYKVVKVSGVKHTNNITKGMSNVTDIQSTESMMKFLDKGRADVALTNTVDGNLIIKKLGYTQIIPIDKPLAVLDLFTYIHQEHKDLVPKVDAMIKKMKANGEMKALVKKAEAQVIENILK